MYEKITEQLKNIVSSLQRGEADYSMIPLEQCMGMLRDGAKNYDLNTDDLICALTDVLKRSSQGNFSQNLSNVLTVIISYLQMMDKASAYGNMISSYRDVVFRRMPEWNYMRNLQRGAKGGGAEEFQGEPSKVFSGRGCVYTVLTGGYDTLKAPKYRNSEWDYVAFTDNGDLQSEDWRIIVLNNEEGLTGQQLARKSKILGYKNLREYDYAVYVDANVCIRGDVREYIKKYSRGRSLLCMNHHITADVYEEAELCIENGKGDPELIRKQVESYKKEGFPESYGVVQTNFYIQNLRDESLCHLMDRWWEELLRSGTGRDQLSFPYCCWKEGFLYDSSPIFVGDNPYFEISKHNAAGSGEKN